MYDIVKQQRPVRLWSFIIWMNIWPDIKNIVFGCVWLLLILIWHKIMMDKK